MASVFCIKGFSNVGDKERELFHIEPFWWPRDEIREDPRMKSVGTMFDDYEAILTVDEARELHERYRSCIGREPFSHGDWPEITKRRIKQLDDALINHSGELSHVLVAFYEWDSGM